MLPNAGLFGFFQHGDIRQIPVENQFIDFANDRGCFHVLEAQDRPRLSRKSIASCGKAGFISCTYSATKNPRGRPASFYAQRIGRPFQRKFKCWNFWEGAFEGSAKTEIVFDVDGEEMNGSEQRLLQPK